MKLWRRRRERIAHSERLAAEHRAAVERLKQRDPYVHDLADFAVKQMRMNHLTEMFLSNIREKG